MDKNDNSPSLSFDEALSILDDESAEYESSDDIEEEYEPLDDNSEDYDDEEDSEDSEEHDDDEDQDQDTEHDDESDDEDDTEDTGPVEEVEVVVDGKTVKVPLDELKSNYSGKVNYNLKYQELAESRKFFEERVKESVILKAHELSVIDQELEANYELICQKFGSIEQFELYADPNIVQQAKLYNQSLIQRKQEKEQLLTQANDEITQIRIKDLQVNAKEYFRENPDANIEDFRKIGVFLRGMGFSTEEISSFSSIGAIRLAMMAIKADKSLNKVRKESKTQRRSQAPKSINNRTNSPSRTKSSGSGSISFEEALALMDKPNKRK